MSTAITMQTKKKIPEIIAHGNTMVAIQTAIARNPQVRQVTVTIARKSNQTVPTQAKETRAPAKSRSPPSTLPCLARHFHEPLPSREDSLQVLFRDLGGVLLEQRLVFVRQFRIIVGQSLSLRLDASDLLVLLGDHLREIFVLSSFGGGGTELINGRLQSQNVEDEGVGAVKDQGKEEGEATEVPNPN
jgi:hypothetical protein